METRLGKKNQFEVAKILQSMRTQNSTKAPMDSLEEPFIEKYTNETKTSEISNEEINKKTMIDVSLLSTSMHSKAYRIAFYHHIVEQGLQDNYLRKEFNKKWTSMDDIARKTKVRNAEVFFDAVS